MKYYQLFCYGFAVILLGSIVSAAAAANTVSRSGIALRQQSVTANALKPSLCSAITVTNTVKGTLIFNGTANNDLILGSPLVDTINGGSGDDCIVSGGGIDIINGGPGYDVCINTGAVLAINLTCEVHFP